MRRFSNWNRAIIVQGGLSILTLAIRAYLYIICIMMTDRLGRNYTEVTGAYAPERKTL